jgi:hypothetical protein
LDVVTSGKIGVLLLELNWRIQFQKSIQKISRYENLLNRCILIGIDWGFSPAFPLFIETIGPVDHAWRPVDRYRDLVHDGSILDRAGYQIGILGGRGDWNAKWRKKRDLKWRRW